MLCRKELTFLSCNYQGTKFEFTVVQKFNQGTIRQRGCNPLSGSFFGSFLEKQKRTRTILMFAKESSGFDIEIITQRLFS